MTGKFKKPGQKSVLKCDCGRSFGNERAFGRHLNSKTHAPAVDHDQNVLPVDRSPPVAFDMPSFQLLVPRPIDFEDRPDKG
jgi:hypothetical protein